MTTFIRWTPSRVVLALLMWLAFTSWLRPLSLPDEGRYVGVAWEMVRSGDWLVPTLDGLPYFHKPPLFYWITAISLKLFGVGHWAARLAPLLGATLMGTALYLLLRRRADEATGRSAVLVLGSTPFIFAGAQYANLDMLVAGCITAAVAAGADAICALQERQPHRASLLLCWAFVGLGVLAKGLISIVLPAAVLGLWLLLSWRPSAILRLLWWPGPLLMLAVAAPWFLAMQQRFPDFLHYFFVYQHFQRFSQGGFNNVQPVWFYPAVILLLALPWTLGLWWAARRHEALGSRHLRLPLLMVVWAAVIVVFFSMPKSKLVGYVLPAVPPLAALLAITWRARVRPARFAAVVAAAALLCLGAIVGVFVSDKKSAEPIVAVLQAQRQPGEPVLNVGRYVFDLALLLQERGPIPVVSDWRKEAATQSDNWAKELFDAGEFNPALAPQVLIDKTLFRAALCRHPVTWVVTNEHAHLPELEGVTSIAYTPYLDLFKVDLREPAARAKLCDGTPTSG
jgi:4-amino-4-deoxy-L-arabinose transferase-like glycosyltransferase